MFGKKTDNLRCADYLFFVDRRSSFIYAFIRNPYRLSGGYICLSFGKADFPGG